MKRVVVDDVKEPGASLILSAEESHHLLKVRRAKLGDLVECLDGEGGLAQAKLDAVTRGRVTLTVLSRPRVDRESSLTLGIGLALPVQGSTFDQVLPALVQLGLRRIALVETEFSGRWKRKQASYRQRVRQIILGAMKQSGRLHAPEVIFGWSYAELLEQFSMAYALNLVFHPQETEGGGDLIRPQSLGMLIGAEGGFSTAEVDAARAQGFLCQNLGPRILRMETAAVGACFWAQREFGDLR